MARQCALWRSRLLHMAGFAGAAGYAWRLSMPQPHRLPDPAPASADERLPTSWTSAMPQTTAVATTALINSTGHPRSIIMRSRYGYMTKRPANPSMLHRAIGPGSNVIHMNGAEKYQGGETSAATS